MTGFFQRGESCDWDGPQLQGAPPSLEQLVSSAQLGPGTTGLNEWYVCQTGGMPTPPSNEHSPLGGPHHHLPPPY
ncbi:hypothetical protein IscW_ISCW008399 [Ixodes scapularis]|uniref:Uncharacterized protein n=1 Tax=Ixodes scapularis TaxID=6945 RepID=B7PX60_IXOSC|nr:hypothetical protein IscW_ISCW008399 [Ixodes scapularis]|eukprot:XP_002410530.1 hypothetical protein IscW_ISCW008399 [Ixodes scapularis]